MKIRIKQATETVERDDIMKKGKGFFIGIVALLVATVGVIIALAAYFKNRSSYLYDDEDFLFDDPDDFAYYHTEDDFAEPLEDEEEYSSAHHVDITADEDVEPSEAE